jgi:hypothetical protein
MPNNTTRKNPIRLGGKDLINVGILFCHCYGASL